VTAREIISKGRKPALVTSAGGARGELHDAVGSSA
jgi:hypothetical protein